MSVAASEGGKDFMHVEEEKSNHGSRLSVSSSQTVNAKRGTTLINTAEKGNSHARQSSIRE